MREPLRAAITSFVCVCITVLTACSPTGSTEQTSAAVAPQARGATEDSVAWYQGCWDRFNRRDWPAFKTCYADNVSAQILGYAGTTYSLMYPPRDGQVALSGADAIALALAAFTKEYPDSQSQARLILVDSTHIASVRWLAGTASGPTTNPRPAQMKANARFAVDLGHAVEISGTKITAELGIIDRRAIFRQLEILTPGLPPPQITPGPPVIVVARGDTTKRGNADVVARQIESWNRHDLKGVQTPMADNLVFRGPSVGWSEFPHPGRFPRPVPVKDHRAVSLDSLNALWQGFGDAKLTLGSLWAAGNYVVATGVLTGANDGNFRPMQLEKSGRRISVPFLEIQKFDAGKIQEVWLFYDSGSFLPLNEGRL